MTIYKQWIAAGFDSLQIGRRSSTGHLVGGLTALAVSDTNEYSEMYRIVGANAAPVANPTPTRVNIQGDDAVLGQFQFAATELPSFELTMDFELSEVLSRIDAYPIAGGTSHPGVPDFITRENVTLLFSRKAQSQAPGSLGAQMWEHLWLFNCDMVLTSSNYNWQGGAQWTYSVTLSKTDVLPWGPTTTETYNTPSLTYLMESATYRITAGAFVGDNSAVTFTTTQDPVSTAHTSVWVQNGSDEFTSVTLASVGTNAFTLNAAPGSGKFGVIVYGFQDWE
jgi:hypothetical protein